MNISSAICAYSMLESNSISSGEILSDETRDSCWKGKLPITNVLYRICYFKASTACNCFLISNTIPAGAPMSALTHVITDS